MPRYPLVIAEIDESLPALKRNTVTVIADRAEGQSSPEFSNFSLLENPENQTLELLISHTRADGSGPGVDCYRYTLTFR